MSSSSAVSDPGIPIVAMLAMLAMLAGFRDIFAVLLRDMTIFAQKVVGIGLSCLLAKWTGL